MSTFYASLAYCANKFWMISFQSCRWMSKDLKFVQGSLTVCIIPWQKTLGKSLQKIGVHQVSVTGLRRTIHSVLESPTTWESFLLSTGWVVLFGDHGCLLFTFVSQATQSKCVNLWASEPWRNSLSVGNLKVVRSVLLLFLSFLPLIVKCATEFIQLIIIFFNYKKWLMIVSSACHRLIVSWWFICIF